MATSGGLVGVAGCVHERPKVSSPVNSLGLICCWKVVLNSTISTSPSCRSQKSSIDQPSNAGSSWCWIDCAIR
jgi:hypothetical protein